MNASISRRSFLGSSVALGVAAPLVKSRNRWVIASEQKGGSVTIPLALEPSVLNCYLSDVGWEIVVDRTINEGLTGLGPDTTIYPVLAQVLPDEQNGGVSADGLVVTWSLRKGLLWSDGKELTSDDVKFTWEATSHPDSGVVFAPGVDAIESVETPDPQTVVIHYKRFYPDYLLQFSHTLVGGQGILPRHACGQPAEMQDWTFNREPVGTGPFMLAEWNAGEKIRLVRNPNYRKPTKPFLDEIFFPIIPEASVHFQMLTKGDADAWWQVDHSYLGEIVDQPQIKVIDGPLKDVLRLFFNLAAPGSDDPASHHPILADKRVRDAIRMAIDPATIIDAVYKGEATVVQHEIFHGMHSACPPPDFAYDPDGAKSLLDEAGWPAQDGGMRFRLDFRTQSVDEPLILVQQVIADQLSTIGVDTNLLLSDTDTLVADAQQGNFDLLMWWDGYAPGTDPQSLVETYYSSDAIPVWNIMRLRDERVDGIFAQLENTVDPDGREVLFCQLDNLITETNPVCFLMALTYPSAISSLIRGQSGNANDVITWDTENWSLRQ